MCARLAARTSIAACADAPSAIRSSAAAPSLGSVTFCEQTAPTPARTCAQRAATVGDDDEIAMPNCPVLVQRAAIENVTASVRDQGGRIDLDEPRRPREC